MVVVLGMILVLAVSLNDSNQRIGSEGVDKHNQLKNQIVRFVREVAENYFDGKPAKIPEELETMVDRGVNVTIYNHGAIIGEGLHKKGGNKMLSSSIVDATLSAFDDKRFQNLGKEDIKSVRFLVTLSLPDNKVFSFIEYEGQGKELVGDLVVVRDLDKELILQKIRQGKKYLLSMVNKKEYGAYKYYFVLSDSFEHRLHTLYTSSLMYTLLKLYDFDKDELLLDYVFNSAKFILSMQNRDEGSIGYGAFYYSYYLNSKEREKRFVVGTTSKTIFTLLELYNYTKDPKYLVSARLAADWLVTMQNPDGSIKPEVKYKNDEWVYKTNESLLYEGQVLSALSRIYLITQEEKYFSSAEKIAKLFMQKIEKEGCYLGDDYRDKNPISSSWVILSLLDFYKASQNESYKYIVFDCSNELLERQIDDPDDIAHYGRWQSVTSTSGNGWLNEVMTEVYKFCKEQGKDDCDKYKDAIIKVTRWLVQNTYSEENTFFLKKPEKAIGGLFWNGNHKYVRTDSVCHGLNAYVGIIDDLGDGLLLSVPEESFD